MSQLRWLHIQLGQLLTDISVTRRVNYRLQAGLQLKWVTGGAGRRFHGKSDLVWSSLGPKSGVHCTLRVEFTAP